ncbi:MAG: hypothetical protein O2967_18055 [Proteobacteria bacterium]|nr:hypothetical protein [Pseudomonadota bacterium]
MPGDTEFGSDVGRHGRPATPAEVLKLAPFAAGEDFHPAWLADHVVFPVSATPLCPYGLDGHFPAPLSHLLLEPIAAMGVLVGATSRVKSAQRRWWVGWLRNLPPWITTILSQRGRVPDDYL